MSIAVKGVCPRAGLDPGSDSETLGRGVRPLS